MPNRLKKLKLYHNFTSKNTNEIILNDDPIYKLIFDYNQIKENIINRNDFTKNLYSNKDEIHKTLFDNEDIIQIKEPNNNFIYNFYLCLLMTENKNIINYIISFEYIISIYIFLLNEKSIPKKIIISKYILEFIDNFTNSEDTEQFDEQLNKMKKYCEDNIEKNAKSFNLSKNDIIFNKIDDIYIQIILFLIKNNNFENDDIINIFNELCLESINITDTMYKKISEFLDEKENVKNYEILNVDNLFENNTINFYYILFIYILKNSYYIYNNSFLIKVRKNILSSIKSESSLVIKDGINKDKFEFILKKFLDSTYYYIYIIESNKNKSSEDDYSLILKETPSLPSLFSNPSSNYQSGSGSGSGRLNYFSGDSSNYNRDDRDGLDLDLDNDYNNIIQFENEDWYKILLDSSYQIEITKYRNEFFYIYKKIIYNGNKIIKYDDLLKIEKENKSNCYFKFFIKFLKKLESEFKKELNNNIKINLEIQIKGKLNYNNFKINCNYIFKNPENEEMETYKDENILSEKEIYNFYELPFLIFMINTNSDLLKYKNEENINENLSDLSDNNDDYNKYSIIKLLKIIENPEKNKLEFIKELSNGFFICGSNNHKLILYNQLYEPKIKYIELNNLIPFPNNIRNNICEINQNQKKENEIQLFVCLKTHLILIKINLNDFTFKIFEKKIDNINLVQCIEVKDNNYIFFGEKGIYHLNEMPSKIIDKNYNINKYSINNDKKYIDGIKINDNTVALSSNSLYSKGEDKLIFYNVNKKIITHEIKNFSFVSSLNGFSLIDINNNKNSIDTILLCACRKYTNFQKNGILLVDTLLKNNEEVYYHFHESDFEVQCFCPIINMKNENNNILSKNNKSMTTLYFLAGGFDGKKGNGVIKLFKIFLDEKDLHYEIEFISEVFIDKQKYNINEFNRINCITQSKKTGDILITCKENSNIYLFNFNEEQIL